MNSSALNEKATDTNLDKDYSLHPDLIGFIQDALSVGDSSRVRDLASEMHAADIAEFINVISADERNIFVRAIGDIFDPEILVDLEPEVKDEVVKLLGAVESAAAITQLDTDDAVQVIEDLEEDEQNKILVEVPEEQRVFLKDALSSPEDAASRLMNNSFVAVSELWTVGETIDYLRQEERLPDDFYDIFVVTTGDNPLGSVLVSRMIRSNRDTKIKDLMDPDVKTINMEMDQEEVAYIFRKYGLASAPVVDKRGKMMGVISVDDIVDVIEEEAEEDIMRMGGVSETDLHSTFMKTAFHRFPWLLVNLITAIAASAVIAFFDYAIEELVALAVLMPIVASMAGNAGTQTMTIAVRAIATKELTATNALRIIKKEIIAALMNGLFFAVIVGGISMLFYHNMELSLVFAFATVVALVIAGFAGAVIPLMLARMGVDPAVASGVCLTTVTDVSAFFIFLGLAAMWLT